MRSTLEVVIKKGFILLGRQRASLAANPLATITTMAPHTNQIRIFPIPKKNIHGILVFGIPRSRRPALGGVWVLVPSRRDELYLVLNMIRILDLVF